MSTKGWVIGVTSKAATPERPGRELWNVAIEDKNDAVMAVANHIPDGADVTIEAIAVLPESAVEDLHLMPGEAMQR